MAEPRHRPKPIQVDETPGMRVYCTCGWANELPYCDGAHTRMNTNCKPIAVEVTEAGKKWLCQCHRSAEMPWCDGSHKCEKQE